MNTILTALTALTFVLAPVAKAADEVLYTDEVLYSNTCYTDMECELLYGPLETIEPAPRGSVTCHQGFHGMPDCEIN